MGFNFVELHKTKLRRVCVIDEHHHPLAGGDADDGDDTEGSFGLGNMCTFAGFSVNQNIFGAFTKK